MNSMLDIAAVPWYTSEEIYYRFRQSAVDSEDFFDSFDEWLSVAMEHERQADKIGITIIRIRMSLDDFRQWCETSGFQNDRQGRSHFADIRAQQIVQWKST